MDYDYIYIFVYPFCLMLAAYWTRNRNNLFLRIAYIVLATSNELLARILRHEQEWVLSKELFGLLIFGAGPTVLVYAAIRSNFFKKHSLMGVFVVPFVFWGGNILGIWIWLTLGLGL